MPSTKFVLTSIFFLGIVGGIALAASLHRPEVAGSLSVVPPPQAEELLASELAPATSTPVTQTATTGSLRVPIIVYHIVRPAYATDSAEVRKFAVTPDVFDEQMAHLRDADYHVISFSALEDYFDKDTPLPKRPVIINLDDAWQDQYKYAFPVLQKYKYTAMFFVPSNFPDHRDFMTWDELKELIAAGMTIGDHSKSHPYLTRIDSTTTLEAEIIQSRDVLEQHLGVPIEEFNYPFGMYNANIVAMVKAAGYRSARSERFGFVQSPGDRYILHALNAPTDLISFEKYFPAQ